MGPLRGIGAMTNRLIVERTTRIERPVDEVWQWHTRPGAFERLTPPWEDVRILERTGGLENGARVVLEVRLGPVPMRWVAVHRDVVQGRRFVDVQVSGPFARWMHEHDMTPDGAGVTVIRDCITCVPPLGAAGAAFATRMLRARLDRMLLYRHTTLAADLAAHAGIGPRRFVVSGATGLIGSALVPFLTTGGHQVTRLVRSHPGPGDRAWDPDRGTIDASALEGADAVINLAGANVAGGRWTSARKQLLIDSRIRSTGLLASTIARATERPPVLVSASATGFYGDRGEEPLGDEAAPGAGFFPSLVRAWEGAADAAASAGVRVAHPRFGIVLTPAGGALGKLLLPFRAGVGGPVGSGRQWMGWSSIDDTIALLYFAATNARVRGAFNAVAPAPVRNAELARTLARVLGRPALLPLPAAALTLLFGEMAEATLLASTRVLPELLQEYRFPYRHVQLERALRHVLGR
ncbi:MAG: Cell division inhibitor [Gemmatimonadetes bacterium]|nr:Cell division inhibitor [Gemmatimonadota bacterium]